MEDLSSTKPGCCKKGGGGGGGSCRKGSSSSCSTPQFPEWLKQYVAAKHHQQQQQQQQQLLATSTCPGSSPHPTIGLMQHNGVAAAAAGQQTWLVPTSLQQLAALLKSHGGAARLVAGNTGAVFVWRPGSVSVFARCIRAICACWSQECTQGRDTARAMWVWGCLSVCRPEGRLHSAEASLQTCYRCTAGVSHPESSSCAYSPSTATTSLAADQQQNTQ